jgi:hypothetical protein
MNRLHTTLRAVAGLTGGLSAALFATGAFDQALAQGCVVVRGSSSCMIRPHGSALADDSHLMAGNWLASVSHRYLHSHRHFVGDEEQTQRQLVQANEVINHSQFIDLGIQYAFTPRLSAAFTLPLVFSDRSQKAPTNHNSYRYETHASGIGDARLTGYVWLWDPAKMPKGNVQLGLGLKMPTGADDVTDTFPTLGGPIVRHVDQSIQPGDGGWGVGVELNAYREILPRTEAFLQASYLINPENQNGTLTWRDNTTAVPGTVTALPSAASYYEHFQSIPDQYFARGGLNFLLVPSWGLSVSLAGRIEGVPVKDIIGDSDGFRRPGFAVAIDPGIQLARGRFTFNINVPFALYRNRERSLADEQASAYRVANPVAGQSTDVHGDAAFADYVVTTSISVRF